MGQFPFSPQSVQDRCRAWRSLPILVVSYSFDDLGRGSAVESPDNHEEAAERAYRSGF